MSRYTSEVRTALDRDQSWAAACAYLGHQGFSQVDEHGEAVWRRWDGPTIPMFVKVVPADGSVHIEAWVAAWALMPGVYSGEQDFGGIMGLAQKAVLKGHVQELERRLGEGSSEEGETPEVTSAAQGAQSAAAWYADPTGRHQFRYWDGATWTAHVADDGATSQDAV